MNIVKQIPNIHFTQNWDCNRDKFYGGNVEWERKKQRQTQGE